MAVKRRPTAGAYPAKFLRRPNAYWRSRGLVLSFLGDRLVYSRDTPVIPSLTNTGTPKRQSGPHSDAVGFGTTFGTGTTDMLTGGVLPVSLRTQARSIFSSLYLVSYGGGNFGRVFQDVSGTGVSGGEALYPSNVSTITYNNFKTSAATVISWIFPTSAPTARWFTLCLSIPDITGTSAITGRCYIDGKLSSTVANNTAAGAITSNVATNLTWGNRTTSGDRGLDGMIGVTHFFEEALSPEDAAALDANPNCVWEVLDVRRASGAATHTTTGTLATAGAAVAGTAARFRAFATTGVLAPTGAAIAGTAARAGGGPATHDASGALATVGSEITGTAARFRAFATSGVLAAAGAEITGTSARFRAFATSGVLTTAGAGVTGTAARFRTFGTSGALTTAGAAITGTSLRYRVMDSSGALVTGGAAITGTAARFRAHGTSGALAATGASITGSALRLTPGGGVYPDPADVRAGVVYGPTGAEFTGTMSVLLDLNTGRLVKIIGQKVALLL